MATDGIDVVPDSVSEFGNKCLTESRPVMEGIGSSTSDLYRGGAGKTVLPEGVSFARAHMMRAQAALMLLQDAATGLFALGNGAITIAHNYRSADLSQAQQMNTVDAAFNPAPGTRSIASEQAAAAEAAAREAARARADERKYGEVTAREAAAKPLPQAATVQGPTPPTPQQEVDDHTALYGENEHWRPPAPVEWRPGETTPTGTTTTTTAPRS